MKSRSQKVQAQSIKDEAKWVDIYHKVLELGDLMHVDTAPKRNVANTIADQYSDQASPVYDRKEQHAAEIMGTVLKLASIWNVPMALAQQIAVGEAYRYTQSNFIGLLRFAPAQITDAGSVPS